MNTSFHPWRGRRCEVMIKRPFSTCSSTSCPNRASSIRGLGMRIPRELPIRTSSVFNSNYIVSTERTEDCNT